MGVARSERCSFGEQLGLLGEKCGVQCCVCVCVCVCGWVGVGGCGWVWAGVHTWVYLWSSCGEDEGLYTAVPDDRTGGLAIG